MPVSGYRLRGGVGRVAAGTGTVRAGLPACSASITCRSHASSATAALSPRAGVADDARVAALGGVEVGEQQLGLDRLDVRRRVDRALGVDDVLVGVGADDVQQRVALADVGQELVAEALALGRAGDEAGDVVELDRVPDDVGGARRSSATCSIRSSLTGTTATLGSIVVNG